MWAIPFNLYSTYATLYMLELGCSKQQVGLIVSLNLGLGVLFALVSGHITDLLGRKRTTLVFDLVAWTVPTLLWAFAQSFAWFLIAALLNSVVRIVFTSWNCILVEDTPPQMRLYVYSGLYVVGLVAGFLAPLAGLLVGRFTLVPAMRGLYLVACLSFTSMFVIRNRLLRETEIGLERMRIAGSMKTRQLFGDFYKSAARCLRDPLVLLAFLMAILNNVQLTVRTTFFAILLAGTLQFPPARIALFTAAYSLVMLVAYVLLLPIVGRMKIESSLVFSFACLTASHLLLATSPIRSFVCVTLSTVIGALGAAVVNPLLDSLVANSIPDRERASALSVFYVLLLAITSPFGYLGGVLSAISDRLPFLLAFCTVLLNAGLLVLRASCGRGAYRRH
jgi:MFS family permease